jgi:hypothetical protein
LGETVAVKRAPRQHFQDEEIKRTLQLVFPQGCPLDV